MLTKAMLLQIISTYTPGVGRKFIRLFGANELPPEMDNLKQLILKFPDGELTQSDRIRLKKLITTLPKEQYENETNTSKIYKTIENKLAETEPTIPQAVLAQPDYSQISKLNLSLLSEQVSIIRTMEFIACIEELTGYKLPRHLLGLAYQPMLDLILVGLLSTIQRRHHHLFNSQNVDRTD